jgi:hypothetical protein
VAELRAEVLELTKRAAEAEGENRTLRDALERERARADRLAAEADTLHEREGEARALRDALADLARRLDQAEARLALPWWRRLMG